MKYSIPQLRSTGKQSLTYFRQVNHTSLKKMSLVWAGSADAVQSRWESLHKWPHQQIQSCVHNLRKEAVMSTWQQLLTALPDPAENICPGLTELCLCSQEICFIRWVCRWKTDFSKGKLWASAFSFMPSGYYFSGLEQLRCSLCISPHFTLCSHSNVTRSMGTGTGTSTHTAHAAVLKALSRAVLLTW